MADESLDSILNEKPPVETPKTETPVVEKPTSTRQEWRDREQGAQGRERDPATGQYAPKEAKEPPPEPPKEPVKAETPKEPTKPVEEYSAREKAAFAKAADETRKRQALERQLLEVNQKLKEPPKPFFEDPDGALARQKADLEGQIQNAILTTRINTSESIAKSRYKDYDEKFAIFNELAQNSPYLFQQAFNSPDPAEFVYNAGKMEKNLRDAGGMEQLREKMESEIRAKVKAEIEAELKARKEALDKDRAALPGSLTETQSKGPNRPVWGGPPTLDDILK